MWRRARGARLRPPVDLRPPDLGPARRDALGRDHAHPRRGGAPSPPGCRSAPGSPRRTSGTRSRSPASWRLWTTSAAGGPSSGSAPAASGTTPGCSAARCSPPADRAARLEEFVEVLDRVLTGDHVRSRRRLLHAPSTRARRSRACSGPGCRSSWPPNGPRHDAARGAATARAGRRRAPRPRAPSDEAWWAGVAGLAERFDDTLADAGRDARARCAACSPSTRRGPFSLSSPGYFEEAAGRAGELGFTDVVVHWPVPGAPVYDAPESRVEEIAALLPGCGSLRRGTDPGADDSTRSGPVGATCRGEPCRVVEASPAVVLVAALAFAVALRLQPAPGLRRHLLLPDARRSSSPASRPSRRSEQAGEVVCSRGAPSARAQPRGRGLHPLPGEPAAALRRTSSRAGRGGHCSSRRSSACSGPGGARRRRRS